MWSVRFNLTQHGELYQIRTGWGLTDWVFFLDPLNGGAWPLLVGGVICLVDSVNGRDPSCPVETKISLWKTAIPWAFSWVGPGLPFVGFFSAGFLVCARWDFGQQQVCDAPQCSGRHAHYNVSENKNPDHLIGPTWIKSGGNHRNHIDPLGTEYCNYWSRNEEYLVGAAHQTVPITSLPFVHTARRCFRWWCNTGDRMDGCLTCPEVHRYFFNRGSKSRNKVAVGEPAAGSFTEKMKTKTPEGKEKNNCSFSILLT